MIPRPVTALAGVVAAGLFAVPAPGYAATGPCAEGTGITVVVDPGPLGEEVRVGCASSTAGTSAAAAIDEAGFAITYADGQPFLCRIDGRPGPEDESCVRTPPGDAYWGLFWSDGSGPGWSYATLGVAALEIPPGGSVGLRFQDGGEREDPSLPPAGSPGEAAGKARTPGTDDTEAGASPPGATDQGEPGPALTWTAGGAVLALAAATLALARRRRGTA